MAKQDTQWDTYIEKDILLTEHTHALPRTLVIDHPLKALVVTERMPRRVLSSQPSTGQTTPVSNPASMLEPLRLALEGLDPLTEFAIQEMDPLSRMAAEVEYTKTYKSDSPDKPSVKKNRFSEMQPWSARKTAILSKFTTSEKISIITSFLSEGEKVVVKAQSTAVDKVQHRLEQLDYFEEGSQRKLDLSQTEYVRRIEQLNKELVNAWNLEQRVKALKIAIQCAKLLSDADVLGFYPSKFVLITDILDIFGQLVYHRLRTKAEYYKAGSKVPTSLPEDFTPDMVPESAKETCLNWFYKIASIRELVPRLYVEIALLKSYNFLSTKAVPDALFRITQMINGIGNPLVAVYARCYLCKVGIIVAPESNAYITQNFRNFLYSYHHIFTETVQRTVLKQKLELAQYMTLYTPALDFILEAVAIDAPESLLDEFFDAAHKQSDSSLLFNALMSAFKPAYISPKATKLLEVIGHLDDVGVPRHVLLKTLGLCVSVCPPPYEHRREILSKVWRHISGYQDPEVYVVCAEAWMQFTVQYFSNREVNTVLGDMVQHLSDQELTDNGYGQLKLIVDKILAHTYDFEGLLEMENFLRFIDLFKTKSVQVDVVKKVLSCCASEHHTSDPVITNTLMYLGGVLHDSVNAFTPEDEHRQIGDILCGVTRRVDYGRDFEQQLKFYVEARGAFQNIDAVLAQLVQCVNKLAVKTRTVVKGFHTRKTADFVRACAAYCFITIPSIALVKTRLELYLISGQVALFNQCLGQADACFKAALTIIPELEADKNLKNESYLVTYVRQFLSTLLVVPDNPERGVLNLTRALLNILQGYEWDKQNGSLVTIYLSVLDMLSAMAQELLPYHVDRVEANDSLYGSDPKFISEINKMSSIVLGEILANMKTMGSCRKQSTLALDVFARVVLRGDLNSPSMSKLALNLWQLAGKPGMCDPLMMARTKIHIATRISTRYSNMNNFIESLHIPK